MHTPKALLAILAASVLIAGSIPAILQAESFFAQSLAELSNADRESMERARLAVLEQMKQGAVSEWKDASTGHSGEARLRQIYEQNGLKCAEVDHFVKLPRQHHYVIPFCHAGDGAWRMAFSDSPATPPGTRR